VPVPALSWLLALALALAGQLASYRRSSGERRQQLKWLLGGSPPAWPACSWR